MKSILILGGNPETGVLVKYAKNMGLITHVLDPNPSAPAKKFADYSYNIDATNVEKIIGVYIQNNIDAILVGVADILVPTYFKVCQELGLPCYATFDAIVAFSSKDEFVATCEKYGVDTTPRFSHSIGSSVIPLSSYPLIIKPVDNGAGVGVVLCRSSDSLYSCTEYARSYSKVGRVMVERYMRCDDLFAYYTFIDGVAYLSAVADRLTTDQQGVGSPVCIGAIYPSKYLTEFVEKMHPILVDMFKGLEIKNGVLNIQFFYEDGKFYAYDPGYRLQGEAPHLHLLYANGFDHRAMLINFALKGEMELYENYFNNDPALHGRWAKTVWILLSTGKISSVTGLDEISRLESCCDVVQRFQIGDEVTEEMIGTERQVFARFYLQNNDCALLDKDIKKLHLILGVKDINGKSMILAGLGR